MGTRAREGRIVEAGAEVGAGARREEAEVEAKVEVTLTAGAEVEAAVTHTADREADLTHILPTILEAVPDLRHSTRVHEVDHTTPPILQGPGPEQGLPP